MSINQLSLGSLPNVLGLPDGTSVTITGSGEAAGFSDSSLAGFLGSSSNPFLVVSTGLASDVNGANTSGSQGTDLGVEGVEGDSLTFNFVVPKSANAASVAFDFTFLSEEFPEFVGTEFNDFLSVKLDGTELALDTSGDPININNNFFDPALIASGTIFDGQTPPLRITAPLSGTSNNFNLEIQIADVGDGIYDSAAFINNFELVEPQIFFVDFDGGTIDYGTKFLFLDDSVTLPASGLSVAEQNQIIANANSIYSDFLVEFTTTMPTEGEFSTILVGGADINVPEFAIPDAPGGLLGRAEKLDFGNEDKSDNAFVLSGQPAFNPGGMADIPLLSQVLAHEAGHILGLRHVLGTNELMYPFANAGSTNIGGEMSLAEIQSGVVQAVGGKQNSREELTRNVGLKESSELIVVESLFDNILKFFGFNLNSTASTIFDAVIATVNSEGEVLQFQELGDIAGDAAIEFITPVTDQDSIVFLGKSDADGSFDTFLSPGGVTNFNPSTASDQDLVETLGVLVADIESGTELVAADADGNLTTIGTPDVTLLDIGSSEATDGDDVLFGTDGDDVLDGTDENDVIIGLGGNDIITGNAGNDQLFGNGDNDTLSGGEGIDILNGGEGDDIVEPGTGIDDITLGAGSDIVLGTESELDQDVIQDFQEEDQIVVLGAELSNIEVVTEEESTTLSFDENLSITLAGDFSEANFIVANSGSGNNSLTTITYNVVDDTGNNQPVAEADKTVTVNEDAPPTPLNIAAPTDVDGDPLTITVNTIPESVQGEVRLVNNTPISTNQVLTAEELQNLVFVPAPNANGNAGEFSYEVSDGIDGTDTQTVSLEITPINDPPLVQNDTATTEENTPITLLAADLLANDSDIESDPLSLIAVGNAVNGVVTLDGNGDAVFTPNLEFSGDASFEYTVSDGTDSVTATVDITVNADSGINEIVGTAGRDNLTGTEQSDRITGLQSRDTITGGGGDDIFSYTGLVDAGDIITDFEVGSDKIDLVGVLNSVGFAGIDPIAEGYVDFRASGGVDTILTIDPDGATGSGSARSFILVQGVTSAKLNNSDNFIFS